MDDRLRKDLERRMKKLTTLETGREFSQLTKEVLAISKPGDELYKRLGLATIKRHFAKIQKQSWRDRRYKITARYGKSALPINYQFSFDGGSYSFAYPEQIASLLNLLEADLTYLSDDYGAFIGKISEKEIKGLPYFDVHELCQSGIFYSYGVYFHSGEIFIFRKALKGHKDEIELYAFADWNDRTSKNLLKKYYGIKTKSQFRKSKKYEDDLALLGVFHEAGHHFSISYFEKNIPDFWQDDRFDYIMEIAADYFDSKSRIGFINSLAKKSFSNKRAKQLLACIAVEQNERVKMRYERARYEDVFRVTTPFFLKILESKKFYKHLDHLVRAQRKYMKAVINEVNEIDNLAEKRVFLYRMMKAYKYEFPQKYFNRAREK